MENIIIVAIILAIVGAATFYIYRAKKQGKRCIGCPNNNNCTSCSCNCNNK